MLPRWIADCAPRHCIELQKMLLLRAKAAMSAHQDAVDVVSLLFKAMADVDKVSQCVRACAHTPPPARSPL
jgi:hypothetical protein